MELEKSALYQEVLQILTGPAKNVHYAWTATLHPGATGQNIQALKVISVDFNTDYETRYSDDVILEVLLPAGTYGVDIYPYQSNMDITLQKRPLLESGDMVNTARPMQAERYSATLLDTGSPMIQGNGMNNATKFAMDLSDMVIVRFQLVNKLIEQLRMTVFGQTFRNATVESVIRAVMTTESQKALVNQNRAIKGVDMVPASNQEVRNHVIIPQRTKLVDVPNYIQARCGGVYSAGMGYYLQDDYWYVYPCYDTSRFHKTNRTMTIINVPEKQMPSVERTYRMDGDNLVILATGDIQYRDDSDAQQLNYGNGVRFADANKMMEGFTRNVGNKTMASRGDVNTEFVAVQRENGLNNAPVSENYITANPYVEYSKLARREGGVIGLVWENSNPALIRPGMMVKLLYLSGSSIRRLFGVILKAHHYVQMKGQGLTSMRHVTRSQLSVFVNTHIES